MKWVKIVERVRPQYDKAFEETVPKHKVDSLIQDIERLEGEVAELRSKKFTRFNEDECWIFQGDGYDNLHSLVCPVVISADMLQRIISGEFAGRL